MPEHTGDGALAAARRGFLDHGGLPPDGVVPDSILRSWQRCAAQGLDMTHPVRPEPLDQPALKELQERNERLRLLSRAELASLRTEAKATDSIVILTDPQGLVLDTAGAAAFAGKAAQLWLRPGVAWSEASTGTNAIGTALVERRPIEVLGAEHFFEPNQMLSCAAVPIIDPRGRLAGALDMSNHASIRHLHALGLVRMAAEQIEYRFFSQGFENCTLVRFHRGREYLGTAREGVLAFEGDRLVGGNRRAMHLLGLDWRAIDNRRLDDLFETLPAPRGPMTLYGVDGEAFFADILVPSSPPPKSARREPLRQHARPVDPDPVYDAGTEAQLARGIKLLDADIPLLIQGETGTGKEVLARRIHAGSSRRAGPFVAINCAALPEGLIEAELFGYGEGAFTGAQRGGRRGLLEQADGGTLFLDEIGDMPLPLQSRLLRVLQDRTVTPLGGGKARRLDFAVICATLRPLQDLVGDERFRQDLYFRIAQYRLELTPLRAVADRGELIEALWSRLGGGAAGVRLGADALEALSDYGWPGNFREMVGALRVTLTLARPGSTVRRADLPADLLRPSGEPLPRAGEATLREITEAGMLAALELAGGNVSLAAKRLGVDRSTFYRRLGRQPASRTH